MSHEAARFFETSEEAAAAICDEVREGDLILVKGSRGVETDKVVKALRERFPALGGDEENDESGMRNAESKDKGCFDFHSTFMIHHLISDDSLDLLRVALQRYEGGGSYLVKALNVFQYVTFRTAYASITALLISLVFGRRVIQALKNWNVGQQIREEGPQAHMAKRGTPTMGGVLIIASVMISTLLWAKLSSLYVWIVMLASCSSGHRLPRRLSARWRSAGASA